MKKDPQNKPYNQKKVEKCLNELEKTAKNVIAFADGNAVVQGESEEFTLMIVSAMMTNETIYDVIVHAAAFSLTPEFLSLKQKAMELIDGNKKENGKCKKQENVETKTEEK